MTCDYRSSHMPDTLIRRIEQLAEKVGGGGEQIPRRLDRLLKKSKKGLVPPAEAGPGSETKGLNAALKRRTTRTRHNPEFFSGL